jgi:hypothetical protein
MQLAALIASSIGSKQHCQQAALAAACMIFNRLHASEQHFACCPK